MGFAMLSRTLEQKLNERLGKDRITEEAIDLLNLATSKRRFDSRADFERQLVEGTLLNINTIGSKALSIPCGEYMVWLTDNGETMLVPVMLAKPSQEVYEHADTAQYEVLTQTLLANWNKIERVLNEELPANFQRHEENLEEPSSDNEFRQTVDTATVDRFPIYRAMQDRGFTVTSLADAVGVDPPAISRILRTPKDTQGDPGGRNPSIGLASKICNALRLDPTAAFPDIFGTNPKYEPRQTPGNRGSGMAGAAAGSVKKGAASKRWTQGNVGESKEHLQGGISDDRPDSDFDKAALSKGMKVEHEHTSDHDIAKEIAKDHLGEDPNYYDKLAKIESTGNFRARFDLLCEDIAKSAKPFAEIWTESILPVLLTSQHLSNPDDLLTEFWNWRKLLGSNQSAQSGDPLDASQRAGQGFANYMARGTAGLPQQQQIIQRGNPYQGQEDAFERKKAEMHKRLVGPIKKAFASAMQQFKDNLQQQQYYQQIDSRDAPHVWELANRFYQAVMQTAAEFKPEWVRKTPGMTPKYIDQYKQAKDAWARSQTGNYQI